MVWVLFLPLKKKKKKVIPRKLTERNVSFALELDCAFFIVLLKVYYT